MAQTKIEWTDRVWNPVTGCTKISTGCKNCYAETISKRFWGERRFSSIICNEDRLKEPLHWKKPQKVFVNSMSDLFHEDVPTTFIEKVFRVMNENKQHIFQVLTKRCERLHCLKDFLDITNNIWIGVSVENQNTADERIPLLLEIPAAIHWISAEPLLGEVNIDEYLQYLPANKGLDWVVCGGESGISSRPIQKEWVEFLYNQCKRNNIPFFFKQWGGRNSKRNGCLLNGNEMKEFPTNINCLKLE